MTREKAKELLPVIQAYAEGKTIQTKRLDGTWVDFEPQISKDIGINFENGEHRVKPEENYTIKQNAGENQIEGGVVSISGSVAKQYRPFKDCSELINTCGSKLIWVKSKMYGTENLITAFDNNNESIGANVIINDFGVTMKMLFDNYTFCDGSVCGVIE